MPKDAAPNVADALARDPALAALGAALTEIEPGYVEISAESPAAGSGALALLAEAAARLAALSAESGATTSALSLHLHGGGDAAGAARLLARGELLRPAQPERPLMTAQADVFHIAPGGEETLAASALVTLLAPQTAAS